MEYLKTVEGHAVYTDGDSLLIRERDAEKKPDPNKRGQTIDEPRTEIFIAGTSFLVAETALDVAKAFGHKPKKDETAEAA